MEKDSKINYLELYNKDSMPRYSTIENKDKREIVLLKSQKCKYSKCKFCDYILDNETDVDLINFFNFKILDKVTGIYKTLEVIDSASFFDLPKDSVLKVFEVLKEKKISKFYFESHSLYKGETKRLKNLLKTKYGITAICKIGIESFDNDFRNKFLNKGIYFNSISELKEAFDSPCLMIGIKGQTKEMIENDIKILEENFDYGTINIYTNNSTTVKRDEDLVKWFYSKYSYLKDDPRFDFLDVNTDFGVGN